MDASFNVGSLLNLVPTALLGFFWWYVKSRLDLVERLKEDSATKAEVEKFQEENQRSHKEVWIEINSMKERMVKVETRQEK